MVPDTLKSYLQGCKEQGLVWEVVEVELAKSGWSSEMVTDAKNFYSSSTPTSSSESVPTASSFSTTPTIPTSSHLSDVEALPLSHVFNSSQGSFSKDPLPVNNSKSKSKIGLILGVVLGLIILLTSVASVSAYLVATDKIPFSNPTLKRQISSVVFSIPFVPKTPKFVLQKAGLVHEKLSKASFDFSMAITAKGDSFGQLFGTNNFDIAVKGFSDYSDIKNPRVSMTAFITKDFGFELRKPDVNNLYLKVTKIPTFLFTILGVTDSDKLNDLLTKDWIKMDTSTLDTEARQLIGTGPIDTSTKSEVDQALEETLSKMLLDDVLPNVIMNNDKVDEFQVYKISFKPSPELLDKMSDTIEKEYDKLGPSTSTMPVLGSSTINDKASDYIKDLVLNVYVDQKTFYIHRGDITFTVVSKEMSGSEDSYAAFSGPTDVSFAGVFKFSEFGVDVPIETPSSSVTPEKYYEQFMVEAPTLFGEGLGLLGAIDPTRQFAQSNNTKRRSDANAILNAIHQYAADNRGTLPSGISTNEVSISSSGVNLCSSLVPDYLAAIPQDPALNNGRAVIDCTSTYDSGYRIIRSASTNRITVSAPWAELGEVVSVTR